MGLAGSLETGLPALARSVAPRQPGKDIDHNWIAPVAHLDLRGSSQWSNTMQFYFAVNNTPNVPPRLKGEAQVHDAQGLAYPIGIRFSNRCRHH